MKSIAQTVINNLQQPWAGQLQSGKHQYFTDEPEEFGGCDTAPAPYDYLLASLAACTMITLRMYAKHKSTDYGNFQIVLNFYKNNDGKEWISRELHFKQDLDQLNQSKILNICQKTPVTKTLLRGIKIDTRIFIDQ
ncbi:OsmC family protein [Acinetobacter qingfengensis]|uniref:Osmotically inducible protein C n=1 Tax=Acinetobacter qingfengensis TaxID=1262585 RepID=A0A1E7RDD1_9GAMM|nr:OsmC family protein [Acinetobacter qingfengensis]KAA8732117.1 OsmC family protein [Acinetobacter qingfengensis]OEY97286.1 osmotically inducible protein C [Acinetobacter qingfengensis]